MKRNIRDFLNKYKTFFIVLFIFLTAALLRFYFAKYQVEIRYWDSVIYMLTGKNLATGNGFTDYGGAQHTWFQPLYPYLISIMYGYTKNPEVAGKIISIFMGSLLIIPSFLFSRKIYSYRVALLTVILLTFNYRLIESSTNIMSEMTFSALLMWSIYFLWKILNKTNHLIFYIVLGVILGLSALTRTEGFFNFIVFLTLIVAITLKRKKFNFLIVTKIAVMAIIFTVMIVPYIKYLHNNIGMWTITGRSIKTAFYDMESKVDYWYDTDSFSYAKNNWKLLLKQSISNIIYTARQDISWAFPPITILLIGVSFFGKRWSKNRCYKELFMISMLFPFYTIYAVQGQLPRYYFSYIPIGTIWIANGIDNLNIWFKKNTILSKNIIFKILSKNYFLFGGLVCLVIFLCFFHKFSEPIRAGEYIVGAESKMDKKVGLMLNSIGMSNPNIVCVSPIVTHYAKGTYIELKEQINIEEFYTFLLKNNVDFVVVNKLFTIYYPDLNSLIDQKNETEYLELFQKYDYPNDNGTPSMCIIYKFKSK